MSARIEIDRRSLGALEHNLKEIQSKIPAAAYSGMVAFLFNAKSLAQNRLKDRKHIVTSRLRNSIYVKNHSKRQDSTQYSDNAGQSYSAELTTVTIQEKEAAIGTNVEYAASIERGAVAHVIVPKNKEWLHFMTKAGNWVKTKLVNHPGYAGDSYLWWGVQNADDKEFVKAYNREVNNIKLKK